MCMMCQDEKSYQLYMAYLDAVQQAGGEAVDHDKVMAEVLKQMEDAAAKAWARDPWADDSANDKTLSTHSPFVCSPVEK
jgi:hypothetical protein